jgi:hypothetical protein
VIVLPAWDGAFSCNGTLRVSEFANNQRERFTLRMPLPREFEVALKYLRKFAAAVR